MPVFALWSPPRARSTAFFRSMLERGDLLAVNEPFSNLPMLREQTNARRVFLKDTTDRRHAEPSPTYE